MHLLVDALSVNNLSGRHVLLGHLREIAASLGDPWRFTLLTHAGNTDLESKPPPNVVCIRAPIAGDWFARQLWMRRHGAAFCAAHAVDVVFSPSGMLSAGFPRPQVVLAQNPWPLVPGMANGIGRIKAGLQRIAFARAQRDARVMVFNSRYMQDLYSAAFGPARGQAMIAHQGIDEAFFSIGKAKPWSMRKPMVLSVSVMARHKAVEVLIEAFGLLSQRVPDAELVLAGAWPEPAYRHEIEARVAASDLSTKVNITGHVDEPTLHSLYADARAFCLLSRCESFGIPAVEAQAFGTPTVVASGTAAPEITAGKVVPKDDSAAAADALHELLADSVGWQHASDAALRNAQRFHWRDCSRPLVDALEGLRAGIG